MYCSYNVKLFKPFISMKSKIVPAITDDWEIIPDTYRGNDGFRLYSKKLNQTVADINLRRFLRFSKENSVIINSLKLVGNFIVGNDRSVYTLDMFNKWKEKYDKRVETIIDKKDLIVGSKYETPCGSQFIYLGKYYNINFKKGYEKGLYSIDNLTKIKAIHLISNAEGSNVSALSQKVKEKISGNVFDEERIDDIVENYRNRPNVGYVGKEKIIATKIKLKELELDESKEYNNRGKFEFAEIEYNNTKMILANLKSFYGGTYKCMKENITKSGKTLSGKQVILNNLSVFDEDTLTFKSDKFKMSIFSDRRIYSPLKKVYTLEVV